MTSIVAVCPAASVAAVNATLEAQGFGPRNFSVPAYGMGATPTHGALHAWGTSMQAALASIPGVVIDVGEGDPAIRTRALIEAQGAKWGADATDFPAGPVAAGALHRYAEDGSLWIVIQAFDRGVFNQPPAELPALLRRARQPGVAEPWVQPMDQFDAHKVVNAFTGAGDLVTHNGQTWRVVQGDGAGNNVWEPGVFGWTPEPRN